MIRTIPKFAAALAILVGLYVLGMAAWMPQLLKKGIFGAASMKVNVALSFLLCGVALWFNSAPPKNFLKRAGTVCAFAAALLAAATMAEYFLKIDLHIDNLFFKSSGIFSPHLGRMTFLSAFDFFLLGVALLISNRPSGYWLAQSVNLIVFWISVIVFVGHLYEVEALRRFAFLQNMAMDSALFMSFLSFGFIFSGREQGFTAIATSSTLGGLTLRRLLPAAIFVPVILGWLPLIGKKAGGYTTEFGVALFAVSMIFLLSTLIFLNAKTLDKLDRERAQAKKILEVKNRELNDFAYVVAHDLKAPISAIGTLAGWIGADYADQLNAKSQDQVRLILTNVKQMRSLIDNILSYSKAGLALEKKERVDFEELVHDTLKLLSCPSRIRIECKTELPTLETDKTRVGQIFQNLLSNAIKFMDKRQGQINIYAVEEEEFWKFVVADNGPGIDPGSHKEIFQLFQTANSTSGVGLSISKKMVESLGGKIGVESAPGSGSRFFFTLPKHFLGTPRASASLEPVLH